LADHHELVTARAHFGVMVSESLCASKVSPVLKERHCNDPELLADLVSVTRRLSKNSKALHLPSNFSKEQ